VNAAPPGELQSPDEIDAARAEWAGTSREAITLRDVLHMSSGLDWTADYDPAAYGHPDVIDLELSERDQLAFAAGLPDDTYSALGADEQHICVIPSLHLVVVRSGSYVKDPGPPVADPKLFGAYPARGLVPGRGTVGPERDWQDAEFLGPIVRSLQG
jgi:CubicO group peptidase (beta-lactamase class C family)